MVTHLLSKSKIAPVPPYDFELSASIFSDGDPQIQRYENGSLWMVLRVKQKLVLVSIDSSGSTEKPMLTITLKGNQTMSSGDSERAKECVSAILNLDLDLRPFYKQVNHDKILRLLAKELRGLKSPTTQTAFEALVDSIVEQQISLTIANMMEHRLTKQFGEKLNVDDNTYYSFPTAETLVAASLSDLRSCGLSQKKAEYIKEVSQKVIRGDLNFETLKEYDDSEKIIRELDEIRGIGLWTAELTMIRGMRRFDAFPADDLGLRRVISHYYFSDKRITSDDARLVAKNWGPWKGLAGYYLIVASLKGITI